MKFVISSLTIFLLIPTVRKTKSFKPRVQISYKACVQMPYKAFVQISLRLSKKTLKALRTKAVKSVIEISYTAFTGNS